MSDVVIGVDLGGTRLRAGRLDTQLNFIERTEMLTKAEEGLYKEGKAQYSCNMVRSTHQLAKANPQ